jgi:hypothetical protein
MHYRGASAGGMAPNQHSRRISGNNHMKERSDRRPLDLVGLMICKEPRGRKGLYPKRLVKILATTFFKANK